MFYPCTFVIQNLHYTVRTLHIYLHTVHIWTPNHMQRKDASDWVSKCRDLAVDDQRCRGKSKKTWMQCVEMDVRRVKLCGDDAQDRVDWRIGIRGDCLTRASMEKHVKTMMMIMTICYTEDHHFDCWSHDYQILRSVWFLLLFRTRNHGFGFSFIIKDYECIICLWFLNMFREKKRGGENRAEKKSKELAIKRIDVPLRIVTLCSF